MEELELQPLIERAQNQDREALGELYRYCARRVFGLCRHLLGSRENAEDATNDVFLKLQRSIGTYDGSTPFLAWLLRVASNQCIDVLRRRKRGQLVVVDDDDGMAAFAAPSSEPSPLGAVLSCEERALVRDALARLPDQYRIPLVLRYYSDLSYDEIAQELGVEGSHVGKLIFRGKQELRRKLARRNKRS